MCWSAHDVDGRASASSGRAWARSMRRSPPPASLASRPASPIAGRSIGAPCCQKCRRSRRKFSASARHSKTIEECHERGKALTLEGVAQKIKCPLLVVFGAGDRLIPPADGERLARAASGQSELVVYPGRQSRLLQHQLQVPAALRRLDGEDAGRRVKRRTSAPNLLRATIHIAPSRGWDMPRLNSIRLLLACLVLLVPATPLSAEDYPSKPIRILAGAAPGGLIDLFARTYAQRCRSAAASQC